MSKCSACGPVSPFVPDYNIPLLAPGGGDHNPTMLQNLGPLAGLIGTWVSPKTNGFNVMPLPQATAPNGFILKNVFYYEVMTFSALQGKVANRGGTDEQDSYTLFYEQRVFFSDGVQANTLVHAENGAWLNLITTQQGQGPLDTQPYIPSPPAPDPIPPQNPARQIIKQVSVPHGNSILAMGDVTIIDGAPDIPDVSTLPIDAPIAFNAAYGEDVPSNPNINPNIVLQDALAALSQQGLTVLRTHRLNVDTNNNGGITNNPFIKEHNNVKQFTHTVWLEELSNGQLMLQYSQNISLQLHLADGQSYVFPHITANSLSKVQ
ncbi:heme-binding protein [Undibacterium sp. Ji50W]|uniref:heme-binding protein n=1 Tax=Undibacterium sp. Ji50W TaxID=3413041 RepID=UPI003BF5CCAC